MSSRIGDDPYRSSREVIQDTAPRVRYRILDKSRPEYCFNCSHRNDFFSKEGMTYCGKYNQRFSDYDHCKEWKE